ncbi:hypothetical protein C8Q76DRAFT_793641 [Earliella scabrosa]|nr:hypothetical protein C8Q76DRAFT_793641 [Earliella scabrosa]
MTLRLLVALTEALHQHVRINVPCLVRSTLENYFQLDLYTISGERSDASTDWQRLNGRGGSRPSQPRFCDGCSGDPTTWSNDWKLYLHWYLESQIAIGEAAEWWTFCTVRGAAEDANE